MSILDELWYGNINPQEQSKDNNRAIKELLNLMGRNRDQLQANMTPEQQVILEKYDDCVNEMYCLIETAIFAYAFRLGGRRPDRREGTKQTSGLFCARRRVHRSKSAAVRL